MSRKKLSPEDDRLWQAVTNTVTPLEDRPEGADLPKRRFFEKSLDTTALPSEWYEGMAHPPKPMLDKHIKRQIKRKKRTIDRTLDLHGMNQDQAYTALKAAVENAVKSEIRTLIVVTGKGGRRWTQSESASLWSRKREEFDQFGGVLKRMVPLWLASQDLAPFVHSYSEASKDHGGAGALYVVLRSKPSGKRGGDR
ncbi:Smr/MutS family protein [Temperatibacter marinus]|uniref:Smr/MutS family protein n=1 Tax=Temperatibacter marinus TaxID=1456591 RepID=A0AA52EK35_9PROT|nr:Smr/MutS family protein [Temperatibacter marinus]WND03704.1 Smr/MutS family protein [Temperatibacter marinus]